MRIETKMFERKKSAIQSILQSANQSEYYNSVFRESHIDIDKIESYDDFIKIPVLEKGTYAQNKFSMIVDPVKRKGLKEKLFFVTDLRKRRKICEDYGIYLKITSGSTGNPLEVLKDKKDLVREYIGLNCARRRVMGSIPQGQYIWIWPANERIREYFYEDQSICVYKENEYGYKYMMPEYSSDSFGRLFSFLKEKRISWITAPPSMLYLFAQYIDNNNLIMNFTYIECHSEKLFDWQLNYIKKVFGCHPLSVYSSNEVQFMGITNYEQKLQIISQNVFLELISDEDGSSKVLATSLCAKEIPIIRYCLGDVAHWEEPEISSEDYIPSINITGYRCNDYIHLRNGKKFEPFIFSDLMILLNDEFLLDIKDYVVQQINYEKFVLFFQTNIIEIISMSVDIGDYISTYLNDIFGTYVEIDFTDINIIRKKQKTKKYKYFLGMSNE